MISADIFNTVFIFSKQRFRRVDRSDHIPVGRINNAAVHSRLHRKDQESLVKHIPVIAVPSANPKNIAGLADLANVDSLLIGDPESTPIGKIAKKALTDAGIWDTLQGKGAITTTTTAPQIAAALARGEGDAGIVWKENVKADGAKILDTPDLDSYVKVIPAALLTCVADEPAAAAFQDYLSTSEAQDIWKKYGYELA